MSRWINDFKVHGFQTEWQGLKEKIEKIEAPDGIDKKALQEIARLKKVVIYLDTLLEAVDPELVNLGSMLSHSQNQTKHASDQITNFVANKNIQHIIQANNHIDNLLSYISPYITNSKNGARAASNAFKEYSKTINEQIDTVSSKAEKSVQEAQQYKEKASQSYENIKSLENTIRALESEFLKDDNGQKSLKSQTHQVKTELENLYKKIKEYHGELTKGNEEKESIILQIKNAQENALKSSQNIQEQEKSSDTIITNLESFHQKIFGKQEGENNEPVGGLKQEIDARRKDLESFSEEQKTTHQTLKEEIEGLLPGATSAGLATAYKDMKKSFEKPIRNYSRAFYGALGVLLLVGFIFITDDIGGARGISFINVDEPIKLLNNLLFKAPIFIPVLWFALFASKRRSEAQRLQQEYAHKEAIAKSYQGFKEQIDNLNSEDKLLTEQLLKTAIESIAFNASNTLDKKHGDNTPVQEVVDTVMRNNK